MALAYESNTDLAYDTDVLRKCGEDYKKIADDLREMAKKLNDLLTDLKNNGWTTPAGSAFQEMVETDWEENIEKYANLLDTLQKILNESADKYDHLTTDHIEKTKLH